MNAPPLLVGAALLFWGWQTGLLLLAGAAAILLEASRLATWRWDLSRQDFARVADLGRVILVGMAVYLVATRGVARSVLGLIQWFPLAVLPLVAAQAYGPPDGVDLRTFALIFRRDRPTDTAGGFEPVALGYPFAALTVLSASTGGGRGPAFYLGLCALVAWALWRVRSPRFSPAVWALVLITSAGVGYAGHVGLRGLQALIEATMLEWYLERVGRDADALRGITAIGRIGRLKLSDRILMRVDLGPGRPPPVRLRDASYNVYGAGTWGTADAAFAPVRPESDLRTWLLRPAASLAAPVTVAAYLRQGRGLLALPAGAARLEGLVVVGLQQNRLGAARVDEGPGLVTYRARASADAQGESPPDPLDLRVARAELPLVAAVAAELGLGSRAPEEALAAVVSYFRDRFRYSLYQAPRDRRTPPLEEFLLRSRAGHCEYFATATVLLLRAAGIPARYATGYAVSEWSPRERVYVVRSRHGHAWARAWVGGAWRDVDTTPPVWAAAEREAAPWWEPFYDLGAWPVFLFERWRWGDRDTGAVGYLGWLLVPLLAILGWRLYSRKRVTRSAPVAPAPGPPVARPGADSEFYAIERRLAARGLGRHPWEPVGTWVRRLDAIRPEDLPTASLAAIAALHCRYRFDPDGCPPAERAALRAAVAEWLAREGPAPVQSRP